MWLTTGSFRYIIPRKDYGYDINYYLFYWNYYPFIYHLDYLFKDNHLMNYNILFKYSKNNNVADRIYFICG